MTFEAWKERATAAESEREALRARVKELEAHAERRLAFAAQCADQVDDKVREAVAKERAAIVAWLRSHVFNANGAYEAMMDALAEDIANGAHVQPAGTAEGER